MCGNTRPKFLEVTYGRTSQDNKGLLTMSSPVLSHSTLYGVPHKLRTCTPRWSPGLRCTTSDRQLMHSGPTTWYYDEDEYRFTLGTFALAAPLQLTTSQSKTQNFNLLLSYDPLTTEPLKVVAVFATPGLFIESPHLFYSWTCFQTNMEE